jgi:hypothetical protein
MKTKKFNKKLSLNKKTIASLGIDNMTDVKGGLPPTYYPECTTFCPTMTAYIDCACHTYEFDTCEWV